MSRTSVVLDRHLKSFADGDFDGILADYSSYAVLFVPTGLLGSPGLAWKPPVDSGTVGRSGTLRPAEVKSRS